MHAYKFCDPRVGYPFLWNVSVLLRMTLQQALLEFKGRHIMQDTHRLYIPLFNPTLKGAQCIKEQLS